MRANRLIALCDILGFRRLVAERPLDELIEGHLSLFHRALAHSLSEGGSQEETPITTLQEQTGVGLQWFSDTVVFFAQDDSDEACRRLCTIVGWLVFHSLFTPRTPLRAGITYGEFDVRKNSGIIVGKAVVDAYELEKRQIWIGGALTEAARDRVHFIAQVEGMKYAWWLAEYPVPLKPCATDASSSTLAIDWTTGIHSSDAFCRWTDKVVNRHPVGIREKWLSTRDFHGKVCKSGCLPPFDRWPEEWEKPEGWDLWERD